MKQLNARFFAGDTVQAAQDLLGKIISVNGMKARIVETEAYGLDKASHAYKKTARSSIMFDTYGHVYIYLIYGLYSCLNFTTDKNRAGAVLIRAAEPLEGVEKMQKNRGIEILTNLCSGPGKLCLALGLDKNFNGLKLGNEIKILEDSFVANICSSSRIGIKLDTDLQWRFYVKDNLFVSRTKNLSN